MVSHHETLELVFHILYFQVRLFYDLGRFCYVQIFSRFCFNDFGMLYFKLKKNVDTVAVCMLLSREHRMPPPILNRTANLSRDGKI